MRQISKSVRRRDWKLGSIVQPGIEEPAFAMHLEICDECIPVRYRTPANPGMQVHSAQPESRRNQRGTRNVRPGDYTVGDLLRIECLSVQRQLGIEFSRSPTVQHLPHRGLSSSQQISKSAQIRSKSNNRSHVQIAIRPPIQAMTDAAGARVRRDLAGTKSGHRIVHG